MRYSGKNLNTIVQAKTADGGSMGQLDPRYRKNVA